MHLTQDELNVIFMALELQKENANEEMQMSTATESTIHTLQMVNQIEGHIKDGTIQLSVEECEALYFYVILFYRQVRAMAQETNDSEAWTYERSAKKILTFFESQFREAGIKISDFMTIHSSEESYEAAIKPYKKKIGRNDPCPCGSGKKYKNCCGKPF